MSVYFCIPSARPPEEAEKVLVKWKRQGYQVALFKDMLTPGVSPPWLYVAGFADIVLERFEYPGYAKAVNELVHHVMERDEKADWFVTGGDDTEPDPNHSAEGIAAQCELHFGQQSAINAGMSGRAIEFGKSLDEPEGMRKASTFGVMQPTGDRWHEGKGGFTNAPIDRVCGSPWMGREFCRRIYGGNGPLWPEFQHMYEDEHLQCVAQKLGILWQRRDLIHKHNHWGRGATDDAILNDPVIPAHLEKWNTSKHWQESKAIFERLKAGGFAEADNLLP